jgi:hypothetical protein
MQTSHILLAAAAVAGFLIWRSRCQCAATAATAVKPVGATGDTTNMGATYTDAFAQLLTTALPNIQWGGYGHNIGTPAPDVYNFGLPGSIPQ